MIYGQKRILNYQNNLYNWMKLYSRYCCHAIITNHQMSLKVNCKYILYVNNLICKQKSLKINHILSQSYIYAYFFSFYFISNLSLLYVYFKLINQLAVFIPLWFHFDDKHEKNSQKQTHIFKHIKWHICKLIIKLQVDEKLIKNI